ncbi:MAG TPA: hypothetical protein VFP77_11075 [Gemmatimonadaceae bacterium]|jgi:hypothetical protein|nr:hypothetical protein [Gemmatimonadaceae bacterium]
MEHRLTLTITSLITIVLFVLHWSYEIANGWEPGTIQSIWGVGILVAWLCGTLVLRDRRSGYIIMLIGGILSLGVLVLHMMGHGMVGGRAGQSSWVFFWVASLLALGTLGSLSIILAARALWRISR